MHHPSWRYISCACGSPWSDARTRPETLALGTPHAQHVCGSPDAEPAAPLRQPPSCAVWILRPARRGCRRGLLGWCPPLMYLNRRTRNFRSVTATPHDPGKAACWATCGTGCGGAWFGQHAASILCVCCSSVTLLDMPVPRSLLLRWGVLQCVFPSSNSHPQPPQAQPGAFAAICIHVRTL